MKIKKQISLLLFAFIACNLHAQYEINSPDWTQDLILYELSPKSFTSPQGQETGTFNSTKEKIPYLKDLGINAVWLTGHSWSDHKHFYNIWTQYACIRPDSIDATLGTPTEFKSMIDEFHNHGIKVFLDIITHGVMKYSPLVKEHPTWFKGESWNMADFDWYGDCKELDDWWVDTHTKYVTEFGVDGFRLDVEIYRPDLWLRIKENSKKAGHPIAVFAENDGYSDNASDFSQTVSRLGQNSSADTKEIRSKIGLHHNVASYYKTFVKNRNELKIMKIEVYYTDGTKEMIDVIKNQGKLTFSTKIVDRSKIKINIKNLDEKKSINKISIVPSNYDIRRKIHYTMENGMLNRKFPLAISGLSEISMEFTPVLLDKAYLTSELSSHDRGWDGFPLDLNPYLAQGSRCVFGYSCLFTPAIPFFMGGEEFNADYVPLPGLSPKLYKKEKIGQGRWLYGSWIQWDQLKQKNHQDMFVDVKKMIAIRKQEKDVIHSFLYETTPNIESIEYKATAEIPVPYILWNDKKAILIAGNNQDKDVKLIATIPLNKIGMRDAKQIKITDLWNGGHKIMSVEKGTDFSFTIKKDKVVGGGLAIYKIEVIQE